MIEQKKSTKNHKKVLKDAKLLYNNIEINKIIDDIGKAITNELETSNPIIMPVMIGGLIFAGQLIPKLDFPLQIDYIHATRYSGDTHGGELNWLKKPNKSLLNETILLIDDILDEGNTLSEIIKYCPKAIEIPNRKQAIIEAIYNIKKNDILIIAGKGHEKFQILKNKTIKFDDYKITKKIIDSKC